MGERASRPKWTEWTEKAKWTEVDAVTRKVAARKGIHYVYAVYSVHSRHARTPKRRSAYSP